MTDKEDWTTTVMYYKNLDDSSGKPYHLDIRGTSPLGSTQIELAAATIGVLVDTAKLLAPVYKTITEESPLVSLRNPTRGARLGEVEETLLLQALRGE